MLALLRAINNIERAKRIQSEKKRPGHTAKFYKAEAESLGDDADKPAKPVRKPRTRAPKRKHPLKKPANCLRSRLRRQFKSPQRLHIISISSGPARSSLRL